GDDALADQEAGAADVAVGGAGESAVEPVEDPSQRTPASAPRPQQQDREGGLNVRALKAERLTEIAMVTANCWYRRPVMPGMKAVGTNTAASTSAMPTTG